MADSPPRDPKIAESQTPSTDNAAGEPRERMNSNLRYLMKQPSTPWITFDKDSPPESTNTLDAGWGEEPGEPAPAPAHTPSSPPIAPAPIMMAEPDRLPSVPPPRVFEFEKGPAVAAEPAEVVASAPPQDAPVPTPTPAPVDVPPPPAHMMAVVDQVLSQSRPPPADPGPTPAGPPRVATDDSPPGDALGSLAHTNPSADSVARLLADAPSPAPPMAESEPLALVPAAVAVPAIATPAARPAAKRKRGVPVIIVAVGAAVMVILAAVDVTILALRSRASHGAAKNGPSAVSVVPPEATTPPSAVTAANSAQPAPSVAPSASVADSSWAAVAPSVTPSSAPPAPSASAASVASADNSAIDPKTGRKKASYLTISRAASKHYIFLDGKMMLGNGPRTFPVKCGDHTLAIDDRNATRTITVLCGGEYVVN